MSVEHTHIRLLVAEKHVLAREAMIARLEEHPDTKGVGAVKGGLSGKGLLEFGE